MKINFKYKPRVESWGRNGWVQTTGIDLALREFDHLVTLTPITSRGERSLSCALRLPLVAVPDLIKALKNLQASVGKRKEETNV